MGNLVEEYREVDSEVMNDLLGVTATAAAEMQVGIGKIVLKGILTQQGLVAKNLHKEGIPKIVAETAGWAAAVADNTVLPGPLATVTLIAGAKIGGVTVRGASAGIRWMRGKLAERRG